MPACNPVHKLYMGSVVSHATGKVKSHLWTVPYTGYTGHYGKLREP